MNLILHHFWKDVRTQRWLIPLSLLVTFALALPDFLIFQPNYDAARAIDNFRDSPLTVLLGVLAWTVLLARLIQSEPVTGSTSFWLTRPIPKRVTLPSQLLFILVFIVVPTFVPLFTNAYIFQVDANSLQAQLITYLVFQLIAAICVVWLATFTPSLIHFAGFLCLGAVLFIFTAIVNAQTHHYSAGEASPGTFLVIMCIGFLVSLIIAHCQRGGGAGFYVGAAAYVLGLLYICLGSSTPQATIWTTPSTGKTANVDFQPGWAQSVNWGHTSYGNGELTPAAYASLKPTQEIPGSRVWITNVSAQFAVPGGFNGSLLNVGTSFPYTGGDDNLNTAMLQGLLPGIVLDKPRFPVQLSYNTGLFNLYNVESQVRGKTGALKLTITGQVLTLRQVAALPLDDPHYIARIPGGFIRAAPIRPGEPGSLSVWAIGPQQFPYTTNNQYLCVLVDPQAGTGKIVRYGGSSSYGSSFTLSGSKRTQDSLFSCNLDGRDVLDRKVLYVFEFTPAADFHTTLNEPNFTMSPKD